MATPKKYFFIRGFEIGASQAGYLQYDSGGGAWVNIGNWITNNTSIVCNSHYNAIQVDFSIFTQLATYCFRLIDKAGSLTSNVICIQIPAFQQEVDNVNNQVLGNIDGTQIENI